MPVLDGINVGSTQVVTTNDGKGTAHKGIIRTKDGHRSALMKSMNQNSGLWFWSYLCVNLELNATSLARCMRCWSLRVQLQHTEFHQFSSSTMHMIVPPQMISHIRSHSESIPMTLRTNAAQEIQTEDLDAILKGNVGNIPDTTHDPIFYMQTVIQLGLTAPGEQPRRSAGGASFATQDTDRRPQATRDQQT